METVIHPLEPVWDIHSHTLILGTMPSPKSREMGFYYGHPRNRFWPVLAAVFGEEVPASAEQRKQFCLQHGIALWDVLASCEIHGADDASIRQAVANPVDALLKEAPITAVYTTGKKAYDLYQRLCLAKTGLPAFQLPSTSPANCGWSFERLVEAYSVLNS